MNFLEFSLSKNDSFNQKNDLQAVLSVFTYQFQYKFLTCFQLFL